ncbi:GNAT family N-acetyltransferase [Cellulomonas sp. KRMCY2]|uniref:GNAT family N-acetyltransferase n=1 Tax=Cellulomonas sp. KRMCY2 TaxID=1304865 RepID=UPI0009DF4E4B|nr:GNAT family N-acetyltransferase [Cellulomonas sp. KRMCY2]
MGVYRTRGRVILRPLMADDEEQALAAHEELERDRYTFLSGVRRGEDWRTYLERLAQEQAGVGLHEGRVPSTYLVGDVDGVIVGCVSVRHRLNDSLAQVGGHIGYAVRPAFRNRGHATAMLRQALAVARTLGLAEALVTCDDDNVASAAVIERCGGVLQDVVPAPGSCGTKRRYWLSTAV